MSRAEAFPQFLENGATIAIIGGGPAGCFSALHLSDQARKRGLKIRIVLFERSCRPKSASAENLAGSYSGCPQCAGGISPRLNDALSALGISLQPEIIQSKIDTVSVQGCWKSIFLPVPRNRELYSVYRGTLPFGQHHSHCFDAMMIERAVEAGAELIGSRVSSVKYRPDGKLQLAYQSLDPVSELKADFVVFAGGVNERAARTERDPSLMQMFKELQPGFVAPQLRKALIFEIEAQSATEEGDTGELHFIESSSRKLQLEMCSMLSKRGYITVTLVGKSIDKAESLALSVFDDGIDEKSLQQGYGATIAQFRRDNQYASVIFFLYRWFFTSHFFSRVIYQTFASEKKTRPEKLQHFKRIFWDISSGDAAYRDIAWAMLRPSTLWLILRGGIADILLRVRWHHYVFD